MATATYDEQVTGVKDRYAERILKVLESIRATLQEAGYHVDEPSDFSGDDYRWSMLVRVESKPDEYPLANGDIDITLQIAESMQFEGSEDGINFSLDVVEVGGRIRGGLTPYNYTSDVWVDVGDVDAVEDRFAIFEQADPASILDLFEGN